jgi:hypothetical protein
VGCLIAFIALLSPRFAFALIWIFGNRVQIAFDTNVVPLLGLIFLPWTVLMYTVAYAPVRGVSGLGWFFVIIALFVDLASYGSGARQGQRRYARG